MLKIAELITHLENKMANIEESLSQATTQIAQWTQNHAGLSGMLEATKGALHEAKIILDVAEPNSTVSEILDVADGLVENISEVVDNSHPTHEEEPHGADTHPEAN